MRFAPDDLAFVSDPYRVYEGLRRDAPVSYDEATDHWLVSRYEDVNRLLRDRRFGRTYLHRFTHEQMGRPRPPAWHAPRGAALALPGHGTGRGAEVAAQLRDPRARGPACTPHVVFAS